MAASNALRRTAMRSAGTPGGARMARPISALLTAKFSSLRSSALVASSTSVGMSFSSGERVSTYCTGRAARFSVSQFMRVLFMVFHEVSAPSTSPRSTASKPLVEPVKPRMTLNLVPITAFISFG